MNFKKLISAVREREPWAQKRMVEDYSPFLFLIAKRYTKNTEDAQDVLQDALVLVINNIKKFASGKDQFNAWIKRICINVALDKKRKKSYKNETYPGEISHDYKINPVVLQQLKVNDIVVLIQFLPELQQQVFNLYIIDGFKHTEISTMLNIKESTSRTLLTRARKKMQQLIIEQDKITRDEPLR